MSEPRRELQVLGDFLHTGAQSAGTWWRPSPATGNGELDSHEVAEVVFVEVIPPVDSSGNPENLSRIQLNLDNKLEQYNLIPGHDDYVVNPPKTNAYNGQILAFGKPIWNVEPTFAGMLQATCPKFRKSVTVECYAGGDITGDYRVRIWGYRYRAEDLPSVAGFIGGSGTISDPVTGRSSQFIDKPSLSVTEDTWTQLPGGLDQAVPKIFHFMRLAFNAQATTANIPYEFRFKDGLVATREEDLLFEYDIEKKIAVIKGLGVRAPAHLKEVWFDIGGDVRPKGKFPTTQYLNPLHFGRAYPILPADLPLYFTIPLLDDLILISNEKAVVKAVDDGTSISAGEIAVIVNGILIELT